MYLVMKKIILLLVTSLLLTSCIGDSDEVKKAKQDLGVIKTTEIVQEDSILNESEDIEVSKES